MKTKLRNICMLLMMMITLSLAAKAEYNGYQIEMNIITKDGKVVHGYTYVPSAYIDFDSLIDLEHKVNYLKYQSWDDTLNMVVFKNRILYKYQMIGDSSGEKYEVYNLLDPIKIPIKNIKDIQVVSKIEKTYLIFLDGWYSISDTTWMKKVPVKGISVSGDLCYYQIFVHKKSKRVDKILKELKTTEDKYSLEENQNHDNKADNELNQILKKLKGEKVVIVGECTC